MKNRTSLTIVISLLVCTLTAGAFAQTLPSKDSTLDARPSDLQSSAQAENANGQCPYKVVPGDKVYLQIKNVKLRSDNLPLYPYFYVYAKNGENWQYNNKTSSLEGKQICETVKFPSYFLFYFDNTYQDYYITVHSERHYGKQIVAQGEQFNIKPILQWATPGNVGKVYPQELKISKGNTIKIRLKEIRKNRYYYFEIVSYKITTIDDEYKKYLYEDYKSWLRWSDTYLYFYDDDKIFKPATKKTPDYTELSLKRYNASQREILLKCTKDRKLTIALENKIASEKYEGPLDSIDLLTNDVRKQLNDCMQKFPKEPAKWIVKCVSKQGSEIEFGFAGIPRHYILDAIVIPLGNSIRANPVYGNGYAPKFYIEIFKKGETKPKKYWDKSQGWIVKLNIPEPIVVREGMGEEFTIKIEDWFVPPYTAYKGNKPIHTFLNLKDTDLKKQQLVQKLPLANLPSTAMKVQVHDMENQINNLDSLRLYLEIQK